MTGRDPAQRYRVARATVLESRAHGPHLCFTLLTSRPPQGSGIPIANWNWDAIDDAESAYGTTWMRVSVVGTHDGTAFHVDSVGPPDPPVPFDRTRFGPLCDDFEPAAAGDTDDLHFDFDAIPGVAATWGTHPSEVWDGPVVLNVVVTPGHVDVARAYIREHWAGALCLVEREQPTRAELLELQDRAIAERLDAPFAGVFSGHPDELDGVVVLDVGIADDVSRAWALERWGSRVVLQGTLEPIG